MQHQIELDESARAPESTWDGVREIARDVAYKRLAIVNCVFCGFPGAGDRRWILIDTGMPGSAGAIARAAAHRFGPEARPYAIILTHGHVDHAGSALTLAERWDVPVFAHRLESNYLNGGERYPKPNPWAGGLMSLTSPLLSRGPIDLGDYLWLLPRDGTVPGMPGWRWILTAGHTRGHISLWRASDRLLIAGDAIVTTRQESVYNVATQSPEMHGPPMYFTDNWEESRQSVRLIDDLRPETVVTGHGRAMRGPAMQQALHELAARFDEVAVPHRPPLLRLS